MRSWMLLASTIATINHASATETTDAPKSRTIARSDNASSTASHDALGAYSTTHSGAKSPLDKHAKSGFDTCASSRWRSGHRCWLEGRRCTQIVHSATIHNPPRTGLEAMSRVFNESEGGSNVSLAVHDREFVMPLPIAERRRSRPSSERLRERETVLNAVRDLVDGTWGNAGNVLIVEGAPGVGKTAVLNRACRLAAEGALVVSRVRCSQPEMARAYAVARRLLPPSTDCRAAASHEDQLVERALNGQEIADDQLSSVFHGFNAMLAGLGPVVMVIDDAQWADAESAAWLQFLARRLDDAKVRMIIGMLPQRSNAPLSAVDRFSLAPIARVFELQPLHESSTAEVISELIGETCGPIGADVVHRLTGGNPFLLASLVGAMAQRESTTSVAELKDVAAPTVMRWIRTRLASLPQGALHLIEAAAVLGVDVNLREAATVAGIDLVDAGAIADAVADVDVFRPGRPLNFCVPMLRSSVYREMSPTRRSAHHLRAARMIVDGGGSQSEAANHLMKTDPQDEQWIVTLLSRAAREALCEGRGVGTAMRYLERARVETSPSIDSADFRLALAEIESRSGRSAALEHFRVANELPHDADDIVTMGLRLLNIFYGSAKHALDLIEMLTDPATQRGLDPYLCLHVNLVDAVVRSSVPAAAALAQLLPLVPIEHSRSPVVRAAELHSVIGACTDPPSSATIERLVDAVDRHLDPSDDGALADLTITQVNIQVLQMLVLSGDHARAGPLLQTLRSHLQAMGRDEQWINASAVLVDCLMSQGRFSAVDELLGEMLRVDLEDHPVRHDRLVLAAAELAAVQGRPVVDMSVLRVSSFPAAVDLPASLHLAEAMGRMHLRTHNWTAALGQFERASRLANQGDIRRPSIARSRSGMCEALVALGDRKQAVSLAAEDLAVARQFRARLPVAVSLRTVASMVEPADRVPLLEEALALLADTSADLERCRTLLDLGVAHRQAGGIIEAKDHLRAAADLAVEMGALGLAEVVCSELRASGARPRRLRLSGSEALTPSEHRVALLAAQGHTNRAIAAQLFVSLKTVESHLARAFKKLGINSRAELSKLLTSLAERPAKSA
ncbi:MAG: AAA family ATPase [Ilumatobacteraceae bacterium]